MDENELESSRAAQHADETVKHLEVWFDRWAKVGWRLHNAGTAEDSRLTTINHWDWNTFKHNLHHIYFRLEIYFSQLLHKQSISLPSIAVATFVWIECVTEEMFRAVRNDIICLWCFWCFFFWTCIKAAYVASRATFWSLSALRLELRFWPCGKDADLGMEVSLLHTSLASLTKSFIARCPSRVAPWTYRIFPNCLLKVLRPTFFATLGSLGSQTSISLPELGFVRLALEASAELPIFISFTTGSLGCNFSRLKL